MFTNEIVGDVSVSNFPATQPVSGPLTDTELRATPVPVSGPLTDTQLRATPVPVTIGASPSVATVTQVSVSPTVTTLSASNPSKTKVVIHNEGGTLYVKLGSGASASSYSYRLTANAVVEIEGYTGVITGTKASGTSNALVTEVGI